MPAKTESVPRALEMKRMLAKKYENLVKSISSKPRKLVYQRRAEKYRRQVEQLERALQV